VTGKPGFDLDPIFLWVLVLGLNKRQFSKRFRFVLRRGSFQLGGAASARRPFWRAWLVVFSCFLLLFFCLRQTEGEDAWSTSVAKEMEEVAFNWFGTKYTWAELPSLIPEEGEYDVSKLLPGPLQHMSWLEAYKMTQKYQVMGQLHVLYSKWQIEYGGSMSANIVVPRILFSRDNGDIGKQAVPMRFNQVLVNHPDDAETISRVHVRKSPSFTSAMWGSIISTTDNEHWKNQREHLVTAFLPDASLSQIFPTTLKRAKDCTERLRQLSEECSKPVEMYDFMLYETKAQLQLSLMGLDEATMKETNPAFRDSLAGRREPKYARKYCNFLTEHFHNGETSCPALREDVEAGKCPVAKGPLSNRIGSMGADTYTDKGNAFIFAFAGHDTTGSTLTWFLYHLFETRDSHSDEEKNRRADIRRRVLEEVDAFWKELDGRDPTYYDLKKLPFMTKCLMETLRITNAVLSGTYRWMQFDDYVTGPNGTKVLLKKDQLIQVPNWSRHHNPELWGDDVEKFNPDRKWQDNEIWHNKGFAAYNPATERFTPFAASQRHCIGQPFANVSASRCSFLAFSHFTSLTFV